MPVAAYAEHQRAARYLPPCSSLTRRTVPRDAHDAVAGPSCGSGPHQPDDAATAFDSCYSVAPNRTCIIRLLIFVIALQVVPALALAQPVACPQFFPGGQPPALLNPRLAQRTTLLCNDACATLASGVTHGPIWSAEHPTAASLDAARGTPRQGEFHPEDRLPPADQAQLENYRRSGYDRGHMAPSGDMPDEQAQQQSFLLANMVP